MAFVLSYQFKPKSEDETSEVDGQPESQSQAWLEQDVSQVSVILV